MRATIQDMVNITKKPESELFQSIVWQCKVCLNINYAQEEFCFKCGCDWREKRKLTKLQDGNV